MSEWISIKDSLPKLMTNKVLVCCKNGYVGFGHYENYRGTKTWYNLESQKPFSAWDCEDGKYEVTHWKPLPEPPKGATRMSMKIERTWAMPNKWTFGVKPIKEFLKEEINDGLWIDPFAGELSPANITNDLNPKQNTDYHLNAIDFLKLFDDNSVDGVLYDPPYSPRQVKECYDDIGKITWDGKVNFWSDVKDEISRITKIGGKVICFGWNSMGIGKNRGFEMTRILIVPHGGNHNDTICTVEIKRS